MSNIVPGCVGQSNEKIVLGVAGGLLFDQLDVLQHIGRQVAFIAYDFDSDLVQVADLVLVGD